MKQQKRLGTLIQKRNIVMVALVISTLTFATAYTYGMYSDSVSQATLDGYVAGFEDGKVSPDVQDALNQVYDIGFGEGQMSLYNQIIASLSQDGAVTIPITIATEEGNQTIPLTLVPYIEE